MAARPKNSGLTPLLSLLSLCKTPKGDSIHTYIHTHTHIHTYIHTYKEQCQMGTFSLEPRSLDQKIQRFYVGNLDLSQTKFKIPREVRVKVRK